MSSPLSLVQPSKTADEVASSAFEPLFAPYFEGQGQGQGQEWVLVAGFDARGCLVRFFGCRDSHSGNAHLLPCVRAALGRSSVRAIVIAHNHPDGPALPSVADLSATRQMAALCRLANARLIDHLIYAPQGIISLRAAGHIL